ncbi:Fur family transcriptional regulator [Aestuariimicrobium sp. T2.26MG-19.2B]|uniref:Fur family transcriptional regulator n=1 Tax=Aestuariimicrobium sp. T2.26MG-19.2B TaxID=3040679 RepID=UPI0024779768|nr:Fur family transcriptional regulator [Aestuariimicrobium sp. T2.26MG-19.2B]CAI9411189.1 Zinc uptake regulation protein [Aestuariimicrobium sp. T2.26MG-19.2B]
MTTSQTTPPVRRTKQRAAIRELVAATDEFRTAQQVHDDLRLRGESVGLATVYRALQSMAESGELDAVRQPEGEIAYRACAAREHHHHLICRTCGRTVEISASEVESWADRVARQHGFSDAGHELELYGLCSDCAD